MTTAHPRPATPEAILWQNCSGDVAFARRRPVAIRASPLAHARGNAHRAPAPPLPMQRSLLLDRCLTVIDEFTRERLAIDVAGSIRSGRVIEVLTRLVSGRGAPRFLRSDNGPEFVGHAVLDWLAESGIDTAHIDPGKPWQNADNESSTASSVTNACRSNGSGAVRKPAS